MLAVFNAQIPAVTIFTNFFKMNLNIGHTRCSSVLHFFQVSVVPNWPGSPLYQEVTIALRLTTLVRTLPEE